MKKIIAALLVLLFSFGVVGSAMATGGGESTSCCDWTRCSGSDYSGQYVASSDGYHDDGYHDGYHDDGYKDGYHDDDYKDGYHEERHD